MIKILGLHKLTNAQRTTLQWFARGDRRVMTCDVLPQDAPMMQSLERLNFLTVHRDCWRLTGLGKEAASEEK